MPDYCHPEPPTPRHLPCAATAQAAGPKACAAGQLDAAASLADGTGLLPRHLCHQKHWAGVLAEPSRAVYRASPPPTVGLAARGGYEGTAHVAAPTRSTHPDQWVALHCRWLLGLVPRPSCFAGVGWVSLPLLRDPTPTCPPKAVGRWLEQGLGLWKGPETIPTPAPTASTRCYCCCCRCCRWPWGGQRRAPPSAQRRAPCQCAPVAATCAQPLHRPPTFRFLAAAPAQAPWHELRTDFHTVL